MAQKTISYCIDEQDRITSLCMSDMSGNTGWYVSTVDALGLDMDAELFDDHGACAYKIVNGAAVQRSQQEREQDWPEPEEPEPVTTIEEVSERLETVEADNLTALEGIAELYEMLMQ